MIDDAFVGQVQPLLVPEMGTDAVAPMLYWLVRSARPTTVLEVGMGYTTPFLARALHDNVRTVDAERRQLGQSAPEGISIGERHFARIDLPLAYEPFYEVPYDPKLICIDRMTDPGSSATRVTAVLEDLDLMSFCHVVEGDLVDVRDDVGRIADAIDLAWIDTWDTHAFIRHYWDLVNPSGGMLAIHWLLTYPEGRAILRYIESLRTVDRGRLELFSFREPHRYAQNSTTLVRRVRDYEDPDDLRPLGTANDPPSGRSGQV